jgi:hypothetical protein
MSTASLLEKLDPGSMMEEDGLRKATISLQLLQRKADSGPLATEVAAAGGVRILVQTMVLHPVPELRQMACAVVSLCIGQSDAAFNAMALEDRDKSRSVPDALLRILREEDRRAKPQGFETATVDPDLPLRRMAISALCKLLLEADEPTAQGVLAMPATVPVLLLSCGNSDSEIRQGSFSLLSAVIAARGDAALEAILSAAEVEVAQSASAIVTGACDLHPEGAAAALRLLLLLAGKSEVLREEMTQAGAAEKLAESLTRCVSHEPTVQAMATQKVEGGDNTAQVATTKAPAEVPTVALLKEALALLCA